MKFIRIWLCLVAISTGISSASAQPVDSAASAAPRNSIESLMVSKSGGSTVLKVSFRQALTAPPAHFSIANPARLVFDLPDTGSSLSYSSKTINDGSLRSLNVVQAGDRSRLVLNLDKMAQFETRQEGKDLIISLIEGAVASPASATPVQHFAGNEKSEVQSIRDVQFRRSKDGAGIVVVDLSATDIGIDIQQKGTKLQVSFKKTRLPEQLRRQLNVNDFATPITLVDTKTTGDDVVIEIVPKGLWEHTAFQSDNQFIVEVRPVKEDPSKLFQGSRTGYQGEAISLNFQNIPLRELLHVFADITNFNIVVSDSVAGNVSLRLNDVAWDHALQIVLQQKNLAMRKSGNVLWIAPRDELAARDKLEVDARDSAVAAEMPRLEAFQLNYQKAEDVAAMLAASGGTQATPPGQTAGPTAGGFLSALGKVTVDKRTNQLFIYDVPTKLEMVRGLLSKIDRAARQVLIEARIVEASDAFAKNLGFRLGVHGLPGNNPGNSILGTPARYAVGGGIIDPGAHTGQTSTTPNFITDAMSVNMPAAGIVGNPNPVGQFSMILFNSAKTQFLNLELTALEADQKGKVISSPRVVTADQIEALIEQGTEIPYLQATSSGASSVGYKKAVLSLKVKPQITPDGRIIMSLQINKDAPNATYSTLYGIAIDTKSVKTDVLVENGGTVVIGGIYTQDEKEITTRVPLLGDMPYIGFMFRNKSNNNIRTELLIFISPKIVSENLSLP